MMKVCEYPSCSRQGRFLMGWDNENGKHSGLVCATHDRELGRTNLIKIGMSIEEAILFERYLKETVELTSYPDFPEWLGQMGKTYTQHTLTKPISSMGTQPVTLLTLSPRVHNALRRNNITTLKELASMNDHALSKIRMLGVKSINEIRKQLKELNLR